MGLVCSSLAPRFKVKVVGRSLQCVALISLSAEHVEGQGPAEGGPLLRTPVTCSLLPTAGNFTEKCTKSLFAFFAGAVEGVSVWMSSFVRLVDVAVSFPQTILYPSGHQCSTTAVVFV